jgi:hypothetical protein
LTLEKQKHTLTRNVKGQHARRTSGGSLASEAFSRRPVMLTRSKIVGLALWACLVATAFPIGGGLGQPSQAKAAEIVTVTPAVRVVPVVPRPIIRVAPAYPRPWYGPYGWRYWNGVRWVR